MTITKTDIIGKIRKAIDDIAPSASDSFVTDVNDELWQAVMHACTELSTELPMNLLDVTQYSHAGTVVSDKGCAYTQLPDNYLRFASIAVNGWAGMVYELMETGSDAEKMQRSPWSRGTVTKPKAMIDNGTDGKVIIWWPGDSTHNSAQVGYIAQPVEVTTATADVPVVPAIVCAIRDEAERLVIYRAASIFFEGKKEETIAEKFRVMSTTY